VGDAVAGVSDLPDLGSCRLGTCKTEMTAWSPSQLVLVFHHGDNPEAALKLTLWQVMEMSEQQYRYAVDDWVRRVHEHEVNDHPPPPPD
jgi:hypothetical protein